MTNMEMTLMTTTHPDMRELQDRLFEIYHRAGREVTYTTEAGETRAYWPKRYLQTLRRAVEAGDDELIAFISRMVSTNTPSRGFGYLHDHGRLDLTVEAIVADDQAPYHHRFSQEVVRAARRRLAEHGYQPGQVAPEAKDAEPVRRFELTVEVTANGKVTVTQPGRSARSGTQLDAVRFFVDALVVAGAAGRPGTD
jgi:hypothetical protein